MESSLAVDLYRLQKEVGDLAGFGFGERYGDTAWDTVQQNQIDACVETGLRWVYQTQEVPGQDGRVLIPADYEWSWLAPKAQLTLASGGNELQLPDDFGGIRGTVIPTSTATFAPFKVPIVGDGQLYAARAQAPDQTGRPLMVLVEWMKGATPNRGQRAKLSVFPTSDAEYTLNLWYDILPNALSASLPHVYGGAAHAETYLAAVRAAYEDKYLGGGNGKEKATFLERLRASVQRDRKFKPVHIGKNLDYSDVPDSGRPLGTIHFSYGNYSVN